MKKLNRKGFTLVELLAVIIILAIVVGITIPAILTTTNKAKIKALNTAAETAADWFDRQYQVAVTGLSADGVATLDNAFSTLCGENGANCHDVVNGKDITDILKSAGLKPSNFATSGNKVFIDPKTGRSCVKLVAVTKTETTPAGDYLSGAIACGGVCTAAQCTSNNPPTE